ncbi:YveK family protein [uncultured Marinococcus sp.]|uniref:YveK family protein n=1 Tax=uncultured Marinococcus sp. TaxID=487012 RepID=UPI002634B3AA|nr:Wzz/FepE/Etk N-terminal domain-containing protein [uncultured Marinococcus sp.]
MKESISVLEILKIAKKHMGLIFSIVLITLIVGAIITFFVLTPRYQASTQVLVNQSQNENEELTTTDLQSSRELISTYNVIMTSPAILEPVLEKTNFQSSTSDLRSKISVTAEEESQVATVTIEDTSPQKAVKLANTLAETFEQEISTIMDVDNVSILSQAKIAESNTPVYPQPVLNLFISLMIGLILGVSLAFMIEFLDKSIKNEEDITEELSLPILGTIPIIDKKDFD